MNANKQKEYQYILQDSKGVSGNQVLQQWIQPGQSKNTIWMQHKPSKSSIASRNEDYGTPSDMVQFVANLRHQGGDELYD